MTSLNDLTDDLKSPTCWDCAHQHGFTGEDDIVSCWNDECANCGKYQRVCLASDWRRPPPPINDDLTEPKAIAERANTIAFTMKFTPKFVLALHDSINTAEAALAQYEAPSNAT